MQELTFEQAEEVSGGDRGTIVAGSAVTTGMGAGGYAAAAARGAGYGARAGAIFGVAGFIGGAILGGAVAFIAYEIAAE